MIIRNRWTRRVISALALTVGFGWNTCGAQEAGDVWPGSGSYMRVVDESDSTMRLDMAVRLFVPREGSGPTIALAGAMHIADKQFYELLQRFLDSQDLVLFEGVKPRGVGGLPTDDDAVRHRRTEGAIRFVAIMLHREHADDAEYPESLDAFVQSLEQTNGAKAALVRTSIVDAWGRPIEYRADGRRFDLRSLGADGEVGGEGVNADLLFSDQEPLTDAETGSDPGLQAQMAQALGLAFQLDEMNHDGPTYRNSDLTIDQVQERIAARGGDGSMLFEILDGSSFAGRLMRFALSMVERSERMQAMMKIMLMETMRSTDIENLVAMKGLPEGMAEMMEVILVDRNKVVMEDLNNILMGEDVPDSIGIVYGAAHMSDLEKRLVREHNYRHAGGFWLTAMSVDITQSGLSAQEIARMRRMFETMQNMQRR